MKAERVNRDNFCVTTSSSIYVWDDYKLDWQQQTTTGADVRLFFNPDEAVEPTAAPVSSVPVKFKRIALAACGWLDSDASFGPLRN